MTALRARVLGVAQTAMATLPPEMAAAAHVRALYHSQIDEMLTLSGEGLLSHSDLSRRLCSIVDQLLDQALGE